MTSIEPPGGPAPTEAESSTRPRHRTRRSLRNRWSPADVVLTASLLASILVLVITRLWTSLIGSRVFAGVDVLQLFAPWSPADGPGTVKSSIYVSDLIDSVFPAMHEIHQRFTSGDLASWTSAYAGGTSLLSTPNFGGGSPLRWLYLVMPTALAPGWTKLLEMAVAGLFTYLLVRRLSGSKLAGGLAAFVYPMTGFMIAWTNWPQVAVASVIPMVFWSVERFVQERRLACLVPVSLAVALLLMGGFPAVAGHTLYLAGGYAVVRVLTLQRHRLSQMVRDVGLLGGSLALGVGLAAFQLLPFTNQVIDDTDLTYRAQGFFTDSAVHYLASSVFPESFQGNALWVGASPIDVYTYVGSVVFLLGIFGVIQAVTGRIGSSAGVYFVATIVFVLVLTYFQGFYTDWINHLPIFHGNPIGRLRAQLGLPVAVLAGFGLDWLREREPAMGWSDRVRPTWGVLTVGVTVAVTAAICLAGWRVAYGGYAGLSAHTKQDVALAGLPLVAISALALLGWRFRAARTATIAVAVVAVGIQAVAATNFFWPTGTRAQFYPSEAPISYLRQNLGDDRIATTGYSMRPNVAAYYGVRYLNGHAFFSGQMKSVLTAIDPGAFVGGPTIATFSPRIASTINSPGLDRMGVRYLVGDVDSLIPGTRETPEPIYGVADTIVPSAGARALTPGRPVTATVTGGALRGVDIPMTTTAPSTNVAVVITAADGRVIAHNSRNVKAGTFSVPVPLADEPGDGQTASTGPLTVTVTVDQPGVTATADSTGLLRVGAVRPGTTASTSRLVFAGDGIVIFERLNYVPRIHWAGSATVVQDAAQRLSAVTSTPVTKGSVVLAVPPRTPLPTSGASPTSFSVVEDSGDAIRVRVNTPTAGYVVVADTIQSDFVSTVDGRSSAVVSADYAVGAVYVPAGSHEVSLHYAPRGRRTGTYISLVSAVVLIAVAATPLWRRRRRKSARSDLSERTPTT